MDKVLLMRKKILLKRLEEAQQLEVKEPRKGICEYGYYREIPLLRKIFRKWPKFSGNDMFPVPAPNDTVMLIKIEDTEEVNPEKLPPFMAFQTLPLWEGEYGKLRLELLEFVIQELKADIAKGE